MTEDFAPYIPKSEKYELSDEQHTFYVMIDSHLKLKSFWDFDKRECDIDGLRNALPAMSGGEAVMARFFCGVWCGDNPLEFDMFQAVKQLDTTQLDIIKKWLDQPEFP